MVRRQAGKLLIILAVLVSLKASVAWADTLLGTLNEPNADLSVYTGPYGTASFTLASSTEVDVVFTAAAGYLFVGAKEVGVALTCGACADVFLTSVPFNTTIYLGSASIAGSPPQVDEVGNYNLVLSQVNASNGAATVSFHLNAFSGTWNSVHDIINTGANPNIAINGITYPTSWIEAHVAVIGTHCGQEGSPCTGFTGGAAGSVPEPGTLALLGAGLLALGAVGRRFRN